MGSTKAQIISAREAGMPVLDAGEPVFDADAIARADETLKAMSGSFQQWLEADLRKLHQARLDAERAGWSDMALDQLLGVAHDIKGIGESYGYPLATRIAASLCRLIETEAGKAAARANPALAGAHVDALRAIVRDRITSADHPTGRAVLTTLAAEVDKLGVAPR
jgi:HPt (histidine-containing phosphotransfer) domain-containing protein